MTAAEYAALPRWRQDWLVRHLWREGLAATPYAVHCELQRMVRITGDGPQWRVWLQEAGGEFDVRRVRADREWDFDALIRHA